MYITFIILIIMALLIAIKISITDYRRFIIPDVYLFPFLFLGLIIQNYFIWPISTKEGGITGLLSFIFVFIIGKIYEKKTKRDSIGLGDIKLISIGGVWLGSLGLSICMIFSSFLAFLFQYKTKQKYIPFAPFFFISFVFSLITIIFLL